MSRDGLTGDLAAGFRNREHLGGEEAGRSPRSMLQTARDLPSR
jgi:hypothetical protein